MVRTADRVPARRRFVYFVIAKIADFAKNGQLSNLGIFGKNERDEITSSSPT